MSQKLDLTQPNFLIQMHDVDGQQVYGCQFTSASEASKVIVGVGCVLVDYAKNLCLLGNEANKLFVIQDMNQSITSYFEDFGGKIENKHEHMHLVDVALSELYEETAMTLNLHAHDIIRSHHTVVQVPYKQGLYYMVIFINCNLDIVNRSTFARAFQNNLESLRTSRNIRRIPCEKQFLEISDVQIFRMNDIINSQDPKIITGFYNTSEPIYQVTSMCQTPCFISQRVHSAISQGLASIKKNNVIDVTGYHQYGLHQFVSNENKAELKQQIHNQDLVAYLIKYVVSHINLPEGVAIGGDVPIIYYNDIAKRKSLPVHELSCPKLELYTNSLCMQLFSNVYLRAYNETDTTHVILSKFLHRGQTTHINTKYSRGVFFCLSNRIYFSYIATTNNSHEPEIHEYRRMYLGLVRLYDELIVTVSDLFFKQLIAVDCHNSVAMGCINKLRAWKAQLSKHEPRLTYFDCADIKQARHWNPASLDNFMNVKNMVQPTNIYQGVSKKHISDLNIKGKYHLFNQIYKSACKFDSQFPSESVMKLKDASLSNLNATYTEPFLSRCSAPFEIDCMNNPATHHLSPFLDNIGIIGRTFNYNGLCFASESLHFLPTFYLNAGLYDCFLIKARPKTYVPLHRLKMKNQDGSVDDKDSTFRFYQVASECIYPSETEFRVIDVDFDIIKVITCSTHQTLTRLLMKETVTDEAYTIEYFWRRFVTLDTTLDENMEPEVDLLDVT